MIVYIIDPHLLMAYNDVTALSRWYYGGRGTGGGDGTAGAVESFSVDVARFVSPLRFHWISLVFSRFH